MTLTLALLYTTIDSPEAAEALALEAVKMHHVACVNILPNIRSVYRWQGQIEQTTECAMIFKTTPEHLPHLEAWVRTHHPYDTPAILTGEAGTSSAFFEVVQAALQIP